MDRIFDRSCGFFDPIDRLLTPSNGGKKKKFKSQKSDSEGKLHKDNGRTKKSVNTTSQSENAMRSKKVSFSDHVDVFPGADVIDDANKDGDEGVNMLMNCKLHPELKNCWKEIQAAIPWRLHDSVYCRAHTLFERGEKHPWTLEEYEFIQKFVDEHGQKWRLLADLLGKHGKHVRDV
ncbi:hypothetical protein PTKIN_Ptkin11bG0010800 [Pterospermum kingtungense]